MATRLIQVLNLSDNDWAAMSAASVDYVQRFDWDVSAALLEETLIHDLSTSDRKE